MPNTDAQREFRGCRNLCRVTLFTGQILLLLESEELNACLPRCPHHPNNDNSLPLRRISLPKSDLVFYP